MAFANANALYTHMANRHALVGDLQAEAIDIDSLLAAVSDYPNHFALVERNGCAADGLQRDVVAAFAVLAHDVPLRHGISAANTSANRASCGCRDTNERTGCARLPRRYRPRCLDAARSS